MAEPVWNTPAHLFGLPIKNWKRKSGIEMRGTLAECIQRFLSLPQHQQQNCTLTNDAAPGHWGPGSIRAYVAVHGLPPQMTPVSPDRLKRMTEKELPQPALPGSGLAGDPARARDDGDVNG
jgi:hypothetical protein